MSEQHETTPDQEPDYRFTLANERTYLAWVRTSLAFLAAAVAVVHLIPELGFTGARRLLAIALAVVGGVLVVLAFLRWRRVQSAMRRGAALPPTRMPALVGGVMVAIAVIVLISIAPTT